MSTLFRRPALRLLPRVTGTRRRRPTKVRRRQATSPPVSRASSTGRTVRFQDQANVGASDRGYESPARSHWRNNQFSPGDNSSSRPWADRRQPVQETARSQSPSSGWSLPQGGPRVSPPPSGGQWTPGQGGSRFRTPAPGNAGNWSPGWRSPSDDRRGKPPGQRRWSQDSTDQQPPVIVNAPPPRLRRCHVCGQLGCYTVFHGPDAVSPQVPPAARCFVWNQRGCYPFRHRPGDQPPAPSAPNRPASPATGPARNAANPKSNWQRGWNQGERAPPANVPPRPQLH